MGNPMLYFPDAPPLAHVWSGFDAADAMFGCVGGKLLARNLFHPYRQNIYVFRTEFRAGDDLQGKHTRYRIRVAFR